MVLDMLIEIGVPVTFARTRVVPRLLSGRERSGKQLEIRGTAAGLEMEELIFAGRDDRVAYSRDLFAPGGIEVMVMRSLDSPSPVRVAADARPRRRAAGRAARRHVRARRPATLGSAEGRRAMAVMAARAGARRWARSPGRWRCWTRWPRQRSGLGVNELARRIGVNASTASRLLATLQEGGLVTREATAAPTGSGCGW